MSAVICPGCQTTYRCPAEKAVTVFNCDTCGQHVQIPAPAGQVNTASDDGNDANSDQTAQAWWYESDGERCGPFTQQQLLDAVKKERVRADTFVWSDGMDDWQPAHKAFTDQFDDPNEATAWGLQKTAAVVLTMIAVAAVFGLGAVYAFYTPTPKPGSGSGSPPPIPKKSEGVGPERMGLSLDEVGALAMYAEGEQKTEAVNFLVARAVPDAINCEQRVHALKHLAAAKDAAAVPALLPLLDSSDERIRQGAVDALEPAAIGWPEKKDGDAVAKALKHNQPGRKRYALAFYAAHKAEQDQLNDIVAALEAKEPSVRKAALLAVKHNGPDDVPGAFEKVFERLTDLDPDTAATASEVVGAFTKFEDNVRDSLIGKLKNPAFVVRDHAVRVLSEAVLRDLPTVQKIAKTIDWFLPVLVKEPDPGIRKRLIEAIAKQCDAIDKQSDQAKKVLVPALLKCAEDQEVDVRRAALYALGKIGTGPEVFATVAKYLSPNTDFQTRSTAVEVLLPMDIPTALGPTGAALLKPAIECLDDKAAEVRAAALKVIAVIGPKPERAHDTLLARIRAFVVQPDGPGTAVAPTARPTKVQYYALVALGRMGKHGIETLTQFLDETRLTDAEKKALTLEVKKCVVERFGDLGSVLAGTEVETLLQVARKNPDLRSKVKDVLVECGPDLRKDGGIKCGAGVVSEKIRTRYSWEVKRKEPVDFRRWLLQTIDALDLKRLPIDERVALWKRMESHGQHDPDADCKVLAKELMEKIWNWKLERLSMDERDALWKWMESYGQRDPDALFQVRVKELMKQIEGLKGMKGDPLKQ